MRGFLAAIGLIVVSSLNAEERIVGSLKSATVDHVKLFKISWGAARLLSQVDELHNQLYCEKMERKILTSTITDHFCYFAVINQAFALDSDFREKISEDLEWDEIGFMSASAPLGETEAERRIYFRGTSAQALAPLFSSNATALTRTNPIATDEIDCKYRYFRLPSRSGPSLTATSMPSCRFLASDGEFKALP